MQGNFRFLLLESRVQPVQHLIYFTRMAPLGCDKGLENFFHLPSPRPVPNASLQASTVTFIGDSSF